jgi:hypothetical protein
MHMQQSGMEILLSPKKRQDLYFNDVKVHTWTFVS